MTSGAFNLVLASGSPRRQDLLEEANIPFIVDVPDIDEWDNLTHPELSAADIVLANAQRKAKHVAKRHPQDIILAADTTVYCTGRFMGKPANREDAAAMLKFLSGKTHEVLTGVAWCNCLQHVIKSHLERTYVTFRQLDDLTISDYMQRVNVMDKAGAYGFQEHGELIVERIEGSATNVIGLPMEIVTKWWSATK
jgi:septum formation protein